MTRFYRYRIDTGEITGTGDVPDHALVHQAQDGEAVIVGEADAVAQQVNTATGRLIKKPERAEVIEPDQVKYEAQRRIEARYPLWKQINIIREGGPELAAMSAFIDGIRAKSDGLEARQHIPSTFREGRYWE